MVPELTVTNFGASLSFYTKIIGFEVHYQRSNPNFAFLEREGSQLMIEEYHESGWNVADITPPLGKGINLQIETKDVTLLASAIASSGFKLFREIKTSAYETQDGPSTQKEFLVQDPDGYLLRFVEVI